MSKYRIAVAGATGNIGREVLQILAERDFPASEVIALASEQSVGKEVSYGEDDVLKVQMLSGFDFKGIDICIFAAGEKVAAEFAPKAAKAGAYVIDCSPHFRMDPDVPLVVPEVNAHIFASPIPRRIIATPDSAVIQLAVALKPLHDMATITRIVVATYESVSSAGTVAMDELFTQTRAIYVNDPVVKERFPKQIAFNLIPQIDSFMEDGATREEWRMVVETKKLLGTKIKLHATCVRVPVFIGTSLAINVEFQDSISAAEARAALKKNPSISVVDFRTEEGYVTPVECAGDDLIFVSRLREDPTVENGLGLWVVGDNIRKGAALNAVQIAEGLIRSHLKK